MDGFPESSPLHLRQLPHLPVCKNLCIRPVNRPCYNPVHACAHNQQPSVASILMISSQYLVTCTWRTPVVILLPCGVSHGSRCYDQAHWVWLKVWPRGHLFDAGEVIAVFFLVVGGTVGRLAFGAVVLFLVCVFLGPGPLSASLLPAQLLGNCVACSSGLSVLGRFLWLLVLRPPKHGCTYWCDVFLICCP